MTSKSNGSAKAIRVFFNIVLCSWMPLAVGRKISARAKLRYFSCGREKQSRRFEVLRIFCAQVSLTGVVATASPGASTQRGGYNRSPGIKGLRSWPRTWARTRRRGAPGRGCGSRSCRCRRRCSWCRCNRWRWGRGPAAFTWRLDFYSHWRAGLEEANCRVNNLRRLIGIKPEIIKRAPANGIGVFVGRKRFAVPGNGCVARHVIVAPRRGAIALVVLRTVECPSGMLRRRVEPDVSDIHSRS
jgi:hypothetical protein